MSVDVSSIVNEIRGWGVPELNQKSVCYTEHHKAGIRTQVSYGTRYRNDGSYEDVVIKVVNPSYAETTEEAKRLERLEKLTKYFKRECRVWCNVGKHQNIAEIRGFIASFHDSRFPAIVMPKYECSLRDLVEDHPDVPLVPRVSLMLGVASGLAHMHSLHPPAIHRDLRASNILVEILHGKWNARISDFGSAKLNESVSELINTTAAFTPGWSPPEYIIEGYGSYSRPTIYGDIWSYGITFLEVLTGKDPWKSTDDIEGKLRRQKHPKRPLGSLIDDEIWSLLQTCWNPVPEKRPSAKKIITALQ